MKFSDSADEDSLRQQPSDPQSSLSSSNTNEEDSSEAHNVTMMTNDMDGPSLNLIDEGSIKLGTDQGVQFQFMITKVLQVTRWGLVGASEIGWVH